MLRHVASELSATLQSLESTVASAARLRLAGVDLDPEIAARAASARHQIHELGLEWQRTCASSMVGLHPSTGELTACGDAVADGFGFSVLQGARHEQMVMRFSADADVDVSSIVTVPPIPAGQNPETWWRGLTDLEQLAVLRLAPDLIPVDTWTFTDRGQQVAYTSSTSPGVDLASIPTGAQTLRYDIPVWEGYGVTRIQLFIDDDMVCLPGGIEEACGQGGWRSFAGSGEINSGSLTDYDLSSRAVIVLDHERGEALLVVYPTHDLDGESAPALPIEHADYPIDEGGRANDVNAGQGDDSFTAMEYRLLNSATPDVPMVSGIAPAINGVIQVRPVEGTTEVEAHGVIADYPSIEIIRDIPTGTGYTSGAIYHYQREDGGPENLYEFGRTFEVTG